MKIDFKEITRQLIPYPIIWIIEGREKGQKDIQEQVDKSMPSIVKNGASREDEHTTFTIIDDSKNIDLLHCQEIPLKKEEVNEWKSFVSTISGEAMKLALAKVAFNGLLKCDVPISALCKVKDHPELMRGLVIKDGKISEQAQFAEAGWGAAAPLIFFQCMAIVTSQYYLHIITERLDKIDNKLDNIFKIIVTDDISKVKIAYKQLVELSKKNTFDIEDKRSVSDISKEVDVVREKYKSLLLGIGNKFVVDYSLFSDVTEAERKINALEESQYFQYLGITIQAETVFFIASIVSLKIANYLGNNEDAKICANRINPNFWNNYVDQFCKIRHDVVKYLELQEKAAWINDESIKSMKETYAEKFDEMEKSMLNLQNALNTKCVQYIKFYEDGTAKRFIPLS